VTVSVSRRLVRWLLVLSCVSFGLMTWSSAAHAAAPVLDLESLTGAQEETMLQNKTVTSVQLVEAYLARIAAINKAGPGLNAVTQINPDALEEAAISDQERAAGQNLGPAMGLPILLKDIVDAAPMFTSAGDWALRNSYAPDSGIAKELRAHGAIILGKTGLSEWANSFGNQPSGFSNLTGQVLSAIDTAEGPSGSSSGSGAAASSSEAALTIGTETSGSIISPSTMQADVGLRPTVGLLPGYGIAPIDVSQDTAGPIVRDVSDAAAVMDSVAEVPGSDPTASQEYSDLMGPSYLGPTTLAGGTGDIPAAPFSTLPDYTTALTTGFVSGKRIGYNGACTGYPSCTGTVSSSQSAIDTALNALTAGGAVLVPDPTTPTTATETALPSQWEAHATIDEYYKGIDPQGTTPTNQAAEVAYDNTDPQEAEKDGIATHAGNITSDDSTITNPSSPTALGAYNQAAFDAILPWRKLALQSQINAMMNCPGAGVTTNSTTTINLPLAAGAPAGGGPTTVNTGSSSCPGGTVNPVIAIVGSTGASSPAAGFPEMVVPMGYTTTQRRNIGVDISGGAYDELNIIGVGYVMEQATKLRQPVGLVDPASYRCAHTVPAEPFASRGHCNPDNTSVMSMLGGTKTILPFPLETTSASNLESRMAGGTLTSVQLVKAYLTRIALTNANGPAIQAVRNIDPTALADAAASDAYRASNPARPLEGLPVLLDDSMNIFGLPTSGGSIALQDNMPAADSAIVAKLKAAGAIILGDTNITELSNALEGTNMPPGYSSLGGQVLLPADTNKSPGGSSAGSTAASATGLAALTVGMETSTDATGAQLILPAGNNGVVALKPTVGLVSRAGVLPEAKSQDSPGPIGQTVTDVASELQAIAGKDPNDPATASQPSTVPNYLVGLTTNALQGKKIGTVAGAAAPYPASVAEVAALGGTTGNVTVPTGTTAPSILPYEIHQGIDTYLAPSPSGPKSLNDVINYNLANPVEGLKFGQDGATGAQGVDYTNATTTTTYTTNLNQGRSDDQAVINNLLAAGPYSAIMVPSGNGLVGIADRAGYPVLTVPGGFTAQNNTAGGSPIGVDFVGGAYSEAELLDDAYAYEQGTNFRATGPAYFVGSNQFPGVTGAPSEIDQSMWRCVEGSAFFHPYDCNAGDLESPGQITGTVTDAAGHGVPNVCVYTYDATTTNRTADPAACTNAAGVYTASVATAGSYNVVFYDPTGTYVSQWYKNVPYESLATPVSVTGGMTTGGIDAVVAAIATPGSGTSITGKVTTAGGAGIANVCVYPYDATTTNRTADVPGCTDASGNYTLNLASAGSYNIVFYDASGTYVSQWYNDAPYEGLATPVTVSTGTPTSGINAVLTSTTAITGTVTDSSGHGIANVCVYTYDATTTNRTADPAVCTGADGTYTLPLASAGSYNVVFYDPTGTYISQWYNDAPYEGLATPVTVGGGSPTTGIDASLAHS
jgi:amidase